jgi:hypothetical protein
MPQSPTNAGNCYICFSVSGFRAFQRLPLASFHLSLTVLVHFRLFRVLRLGKWSYLFVFFFFFFVRFIVLYIYIFLQAKLLVLRLTQLLHGYDRYWDSYPLWLSYFKLILLSHMEHTYFMLFGATFSLNRFRSPLLTASTHLSFPHSY